MIRAYTIREISSITEGHLLAENTDKPILYFTTDTRKISDPAHSVFIAIRGEQRDGHHFIPAAYQAGVRQFIVEQPDKLARLEGVSAVQVKQSLHALQHIAAYHRSQYNIPVIGITGSNGKTIVKEWLNLLLSDDHIIARSPRSYNSQLGVALSVLTLTPEHTFGLFEAGISQPGEMSALQKMIQPTLGIITNIGSAHQENFQSLTEKAEEKIQLFSSARAVIYPMKYGEIHEAIQKLPAAIERCSWASDAAADFQIRTVVLPSGRTDIHLQKQEKSFGFQLHFSDSASIENAIHCIVTLLYLGYTEAEIALRLERITSLPMRMELVNGINQSVIVNDVYSNDLHSLEIALDFLKYNSPGLDRTVILSDIQQSGIPITALYTQVNFLLQKKGIKKLIGIGQDISACAHVFTLDTSFFPHPEAFMAAFQPDSVIRQALLIKGARKFRFERITALLEDKTHSTVLEIDLDALSHNLHYFRSKLLPTTRLMVMVKAFGYGSGAHEIASLLEFNRADYLAVAYTDEGVALRKAGVSLPIMVMNPESGSFPALFKHKLEPEIYSFRTLYDFYQSLQATGWPTAYPIHLKIDTGMHRLGFIPQDVRDLILTLKQMPQLHIASVFTHLSATDEPKHDAFTHEQFKKFEDFCHTLKNGLSISFLMHALNTGGIQRFPSAQYDMVRLGIGLYGVSTHPDEQTFLQPVSTLRTLISQIKEIPEGDSVGYGRNFFAPKKMMIATIPMGYADGLRRSLSNGVGYVLIKGKRAPIVGHICMDMTMVDITEIPCKEGDPVEIFGKGIALTTFAHLSGVIVYEVLTGISQRVKRVYLQA